jgi:hypothetical protein
LQKRNPRFREVKKVLFDNIAKHCGKYNNAFSLPQNVLRACKYIALYGQSGFADMIKLRTLT